MRLENLAARPHPAGNRVEISWVNPEPAAYPGIRIVRRLMTHPTSPEDGAVVAEGLNLPFTPAPAGKRSYTVSDGGLQGETVYYYALFPYAAEPPDYRVEPRNLASAMATAAHDSAGRMYDLLPAIYHRYDAPSPGAPGDFLRRFLEMPGGQLDLLWSGARAALNFHDLERVDGRLLPLLAEWIGWDTNFRLEVATQRNELRSAPYLYRTIGIVPTVEATVKRVLGWESRAKEFVHNIARANIPEQLNLRTLRRGPDGVWLGTSAPLSVDFDHEGRPAAATDEEGVLWLFYSTRRNDRWDLWYKTLTLFTIDASLEASLDAGLVTPDLRAEFDAAGLGLPRHVWIEGADQGWDIATPDPELRFGIRPEAGGLMVSYWTPSVRLTSEASIDKHPVALFHNGALHVFWDSYDERTGRWRIRHRVRRGGEWSRPAVFGDGETDRRSPSVVEDNTGRLWAFWMERREAGWGLRYVREGTNGEWELESSHEFPPDGDHDPRVHGDVFVLFQPPGAAPLDGTPRIWVFWSRKRRLPGGETRWQLAYRTATGMDPSEITWIHSWSPDFPDHRSVDTTAAPVDLSVRTFYVNKPLDWGAIHTLPGSGEAFGARDPAAFLNPDGELELFFRSDAGGSWSIWRSTLAGLDPPAWRAPVRLTADPFTQVGPFPCAVGNGTLLLFRSNESVRYASTVYRATQTVDARYAGSTSVDTRNLAKLALRERFGDFQTYVYDVGENGVRTDRDWYARDTVGVYLDATTEDQQTIVRNRNLITNILRAFLPAPVRVVFIVPIVTHDPFYTYDLPASEPARLIGEEYSDHVESLTVEAYGGLADEFTDAMPGWVRAFSWSEESPESATVDTAADPVDTSVRTWHAGLEAGG